MADWKPNEIVIELGGPKNQYFVFKPFNARLRGRWDPLNIKDFESTRTGIKRMPRIPGICIAIDPKRRTCRIVDPLSFPENQRTLDEGNRLMAPWVFGNRPARPYDTLLRRKMNDSQVKSCLWAMAELTEQHDAEVIRGVMPSKPDILDMPGKLQTRFYWNSTNAPKFCTDEEVEHFKQSQSDEEAPIEVVPAGQPT